MDAIEMGPTVEGRASRSAFVEAGPEAAEDRIPHRSRRLARARRMVIYAMSLAAIVIAA